MIFTCTAHSHSSYHFQSLFPSSLLHLYTKTQLPSTKCWWPTTGSPKFTYDRFENDKTTTTTRTAFGNQQEHLVQFLLSVSGRVGCRLCQNNCLGKISSLLCHSVNHNWNVLCDDCKAFSLQCRSARWNSRCFATGKIYIPCLIILHHVLLLWLWFYHYCYCHVNIIWCFTLCSKYFEKSWRFFPTIFRAAHPHSYIQVRAGCGKR